MIAEDFAPRARRDEPKWWAHLGEVGTKSRVAAPAAEERSHRRKGPARAVPAPKDREHLVTAIRVAEVSTEPGMAATLGATS